MEKIRQVQQEEAKRIQEHEVIQINQAFEIFVTLTVWTVESGRYSSIVVKTNHTTV